MTEALLHGPAIGLGSYIRLGYDPDEYYRIGTESDFKTTPPTIGIDSPWGECLRGKREGQIVVLCEPENNEGTYRIHEVRP